MKRACIAIVDAASARLYTYQSDSDSQEFIEEIDLASAGRRSKDGELFSEAHPGVRAAPNGFRSTVDDHRDAHRDNMDTKFAAQVTAEIERLANEKGLGHVVFVTTPRMLGTVRPHLETLRKHGFVVDEIERDLARLTSAQIHDHLAGMAVIEPRRRAVQLRR